MREPLAEVGRFADTVTIPYWKFLVFSRTKEESNGGQVMKDVLPLPVQITDINREFLHKGPARRWDEKTARAVSDALRAHLGIGRVTEPRLATLGPSDLLSPEDNEGGEKVKIGVETDHLFYRIGYLFFIPPWVYERLGEDDRGKDLLRRLGSNLIIVEYRHSIFRPDYGNFTITTIVAMMQLDLRGARVIEAGAGFNAPISLAASKLGIDLGTKSLVISEFNESWRRKCVETLKLNHLMEGEDFIAPVPGDLTKPADFVEALPDDGRPIVIVSNIGYWVWGRFKETFTADNRTSINLIRHIRHIRPASSVTAFVSGGLAMSNASGMKADQDHAEWEQTILKDLGFLWDGRLVTINDNADMADPDIDYVAAYAMTSPVRPPALLPPDGEESEKALKMVAGEFNPIWNQWALNRFDHGLPMTRGQMKILANKTILKIKERLLSLGHMIKPGPIQPAIPIVRRDSLEQVLASLVLNKQWKEIEEARKWDPSRDDGMFDFFASLKKVVADIVLPPENLTQAMISTVRSVICDEPWAPIIRALLRLAQEDPAKNRTTGFSIREIRKRLSTDGFNGFRGLPGRLLELASIPRYTWIHLVQMSNGFQTYRFAARAA